MKQAHQPILTPGTGVRQNARVASKKSKKHKGVAAAPVHPPEPPPKQTLSEVLRLPAGPVDLAALDSRATPGFPGLGKDHVPALMDQLGTSLADRQECLFANGRSGDSARNVLVILQGMDTSGKGGIIRHAIGLVDPQGVKITSFKAPTAEERQHPFLWRITNALPGPGMIGIFDRSQYEDVLIARVNELATKQVWSRRYALINNWEQKLADAGTTIIKCYLHITPEDQLGRLQARLDDPTKHWKYNPGDLDVRAKWSDYQAAYADALERCNTDAAPWYVIPAGRKWYRNWAVAALLDEHLRALGLTWPKAGFDVAEEKQRLAAM
ncbi:putative phosphotransferase [Microlunatus phosphovorus NM-1]|uniref:Putative phosphotransferase n=1 Tax=Microlunatus phosphovorus (strain ATCC 700054 / DSM 10555 / JCM 9379 / NBRC 101784 / NCIMB 13414 / VKM Ac-1990 / NM-1) TaxID=1032480 RepID=F5XEX9_MICPN|nr:PPK2 family polyphosphate kinase [Microlunatus phosphovorus]BAK35345.1 putative phosphotransferase [Microlunatus phosphovorus NM-1]